MFPLPSADKPPSAVAPASSTRDSSGLFSGPYVEPPIDPIVPLTRREWRHLDSLLLAVSERVGGDVSVSAVHVESGVRYSYDGSRSVFLGESLKLPLITQLLHRVDRGELRLDDSLLLTAADLRPAWMTPRDGHHIPAMQLPKDAPTMRTVRALLKNAADDGQLAAVDVLFRSSGGPRKVEDEFRALRVSGIRIDRTMGELIRDYVGADSTLRMTPFNAEEIRAEWVAKPKDVRAMLEQRFHDDRRDRGTSRALVSLLTRIVRGDMLADSSRALMVELFRSPQQTQSWLTAGVPYGTSYLHYGTTWGEWGAIRTSNEFAVVMLPERRGRLAIAVTAGNTTKPGLDSAFAEVARETYRAFISP